MPLSAKNLTRNRRFMPSIAAREVSCPVPTRFGSATQRDQDRIENQRIQKAHTCRFPYRGTSGPSRPGRRVTFLAPHRARRGHLERARVDSFWPTGNRGRRERYRFGRDRASPEGSGRAQEPPALGDTRQHAHPTALERALSTRCDCNRRARIRLPQGSRRETCKCVLPGFAEFGGRDRLGSVD